MAFPNNMMSYVGIIVFIELALKGFALWRAARSNQMYWFIALLVLNTAGILPAVYLLIDRVSKKKKG
ncbi:MAG: DUF5652 family protein [bacterium]|nr:DUF5652 family protein [bacterium]